MKGTTNNIPSIPLGLEKPGGFFHRSHPRRPLTDKASKSWCTAISTIGYSRPWGEFSGYITFVEGTSLPILLKLLSVKIASAKLKITWENIIKLL